MAWYKCKTGSSAEDGNDIAYPVLSPSNDSKLYKESDVNAIALAIGKSNLKIADMADAISNIGLDATKITLIYDDYTVIT